jgi:D-cysteine desulfhydrase
MNDVARRVSERIESESNSRVYRNIASAYMRAFASRLRGAHWIPAGGSTALGVLGQVNAALELAEQVDAGALPLPDRIVLPLGTGGTAAGIALGLAIARLTTEVIAVRVVPRVVANRRRVNRLVEDAARLIEREATASVPRPQPSVIRIVHDFYGGAYGRGTAAGAAVAKRCFEQTGIPIDPTYTAKALAAAVTVAERASGTTLFWLSFDGRWLTRSSDR